MIPLAVVSSWANVLLIIPAAWVAVQVVRWLFPEPTDTAPFQESCVCGHDRTVHEHHTRATDCAGHECDCSRYEPEILARAG